MSFDRASGVLLHPTSLPAAVDIGDFGPGAFEFIDFLASAGQRLWQVLPLGPTGYGNSPYQCFSAFAGNPLLISLERLIEDGLLTEEESRRQYVVQPGSVDFPAVIAHRRAIWPRVLDRFEARAARSLRDRFDGFCRSHASWLDDFALFMAVKDAQNQAAWTAWEPEIAQRDPSAIARWSAGLAREIRLHKLTQFLFFEQWQRVREACRARSIQIMGDLPIFVAHDSADVWAKRELFRLDAAGRPSVLTGVPPDYFSATGQLWGNPHYQWDVLARTGYAWWIDRFRALLALVDRVRIDHFRGFEASWEVPADATTAMRGEWVKGPGAALFEAAISVRNRAPAFRRREPGVITPEVESARAVRIARMAILQFAFAHPQAPALPHNYRESRRVFRQTTTRPLDGRRMDSWHPTPRSSEREYARRYLISMAESRTGRSFARCWRRLIPRSCPRRTARPGSDARMNRPGR
jgi:4-alpha-glucanotransferase